MESNSLFLELLISGFFAIACFRTQAASAGSNPISPRNLFRLTSRLERLHKTRWQWFAMVLILVLVRLQNGLPLVVELTAALQFVIFLALPAQKQLQANTKEKSGRNRRKTGMRQMRHARAG
jgi:hypothetical protein